MYVKVFDIKLASNIEREVQSWLNRNPNIKIDGITQCSVEGSDAFYYVITIIYSRKN